MNSPNPVTDILFFHFFKPWCWMLLCLGSVVWTVAIQAHWLLQAETKRQMVVVCVVYCDCYLTVQFYLQLEVCVCGCVLMCETERIPSQAHAFVPWQRKRCRAYTFTTVTFLSLLPMEILAVWTGEKNTGPHAARSFYRYQTTQQFNHSILSV